MNEEYRGPAEEDIKVEEVKVEEPVEEFTVSANKLLDKVKEIIKEGNVRRIILRSESGKTLLEIPLTAGVAGVAALAVFAAPLLAVGAIAALVTSVTITVVRTAKVEVVEVADVVDITEND